MFPKCQKVNIKLVFEVIILGQNPQTFMIPIYSTTVLYDKLYHGHVHVCMYQAYHECPCYNYYIHSILFYLRFTVSSTEGLQQHVLSLKITYVHGQN